MPILSRRYLWIPVIAGCALVTTIVTVRPSGAEVAAPAISTGSDDVPYHVQRAAATEAVLAELPTRSFDDLGPLGSRVSAALAASGSGLPEHEFGAVANAVVDFLHRRYAAGTGSYAIGEIAVGQQLRDVEELLDENAAQVIYEVVGGFGAFDSAPQQNLIEVFGGLDALDAGSSHVVAYVDADECVAVSVGPWASVPQLSTTLGIEHWHGASALRGRSWFDRGAEPGADAATVTAGFFARFADGSAGAIHLRLTTNGDGTWAVRSLSRHGAVSELATIDF